MNLLVFFFSENFYINIYQGHWAGCNFIFLQYICQIFTSGKCCLHKMILEVFLFLQFSRTVWWLVLILFKHLVEFSSEAIWSWALFLLGCFVLVVLFFMGGVFFYYLFNLFASYRFVQIFISFWFSSVSCMFLEI